MSIGWTLPFVSGGTKVRVFLHDPERREIKVMEQREFTEDERDIMLFAQSWSICLFN